MKHKYELKKLAYAVSLGLLVNAPVALAQEEEAIEEVVATGSRLQGSAAAVIEERKAQAFVADILGAEQMSRTGDSDAASALRRVTGLTLVDGKYIYVRGLGERYSSARLNGAAVPSPDLTRNVLPLDIIPASIVESLAVQKAFSPSMPAAFGGGSIDIRTKAVPADFTAGLDFGLGYSNLHGDGYSFAKDESGISQELSDAIVRYRGNFTLPSIIARDFLEDGANGTRAEQAEQINNGLLKSLQRDYGLSEESLDPNYSVKGHIGDSFEESYFGGTIGVLFSASADKSNETAERRTAVIAQDVSEDCATTLNNADEIATSCYNTIKDITTTTVAERFNGVLNVGYKVGTHSLTLNNLYLVDSEEEVDVETLQSPAGSTIFTIAGDGLANRTHAIDYEERTLQVNQALGQHTFLDWWGLGVDWQYTRSTAETEIPVSAEFRFRDNFDNGTLTSSVITGDDNRAIFSYTDMEDKVNSSGANLTLPIYEGHFEIELKAGFDITDRARIYNTSSFAVNNESGGAIVVNENGSNPLSDSGYLTDSFIDGQDVLINFNEPTAPDADDYIAAQKIDAYYGSFDVFYKSKYRVSGGIRWEEFKQSSIGTSSLIFTAEDLNIFYDPDKIEAGTLQEDDVYSALSFTYITDGGNQWRLGYGETIVRPDLREVVPVAYFDPLTDIRTFGRVGLKSSPIKNYDLRYEMYMDNGDNYSIAAFYKDIEAPIETILRIGDEDYSATFVNGETAEVYGVEVEWLHDLTYLADGFFTSGNITLSDSEAVIDPAFAGNLTNPTKRMTGHSEYVVNLQLNYDSANGEHSASLVYNVFGERIIASGIAGREDAFEQPFHSLDAVYTYYPDFNSSVKFRIKNLLGEEQEVTQSDIAVRQKESATSFNISYKYEF